MTQLPFLRRVLKKVHPEGIPWPGTVFYNRISASAVFQRHYDLLTKDILTHAAAGRLLDVGTGPGWLLIRLHQAAPGLDLVGLDVSLAMTVQAQTNIARAGLSQSIAVHAGSADRLPYPDHSFETIVSTGSVHHWKEPVRGLNEIHRVLTPGGHALLYDLVSDVPAPILKEAQREFGRLRAWLFWLHGFEEPFHSREGFESLARESLFQEARCEFVGLLFSLILTKPNSNGGDDTNPH